MKKFIIFPRTVLIWFFFITLVIAFGRGVNYNPQLAELDGVSSKSYVAPYLLITALFLIVYTNKSVLLDFTHVPYRKLWLLFFAFLFVLIFLRENIVDDLKNFSVILISYMILFFLLRFIYLIPFSLLEDTFLKVSFLLCLLCVVVHLQQGFTIVFFPDRTENNFDRLGGLFYYAHTAALVSITLLFSLKKYLDSKRLIYILICIICGLMLIASDTRSAWFATAFSMVFLLFKRVRFYKIFLASIIFYLASTSLLDLVSTKTLAATSADSNFRVLIWNVSLNIASERLFTGYGNFNPLKVYNVGIENINDPHNSFISLILQSGVIACGIFTVIFFLNISKAIKYYNSDYRFLLFFWIFFPFFWGNIYNNLASFISMFMMFTIFSFSLNPNQKKNKESLESTL